MASGGGCRPSCFARTRRRGQVAAYCRVLAEMLAQPGVDHLPHPGQRLMLTLAGKFATGLECGTEFFHLGPELCNTRLAQGRQ